MMKVTALLFALAAILMPAGIASGADVDCDNAAATPASGRARSGQYRQDAVEEFMRIHNEARRAVGVAPLRWSNQLSAVAAKFAHKLSRSGTFRHEYDERYGENLYESGSGTVAPADAARMWLAEKKRYFYGPITSGSIRRTGHYTQMVWEGTTHVGFGMATDSRGVTIVVAKYGPRGNLLGESPYERRMLSGPAESVPHLRNALASLFGKLKTIRA
jgi:Cysteine-rich secretory protein family